MSNELQTGTFRIRAVPGSQDFGVSNAGNEQIAVAIEFLDGPNKGRRAVWYGSFTEKTEDRTLESLRYLGWSNDDLMNMAGLGEAEAEAVLEDEVGQDGKSRIRVKWINRVRGPAFKNRLDGGDLAAFSQRMKGKAVATRKKLEQAGFKPAPLGNGGARDEAPAHGDDDNIPF